MFDQNQLHPHLESLFNTGFIEIVNDRALAVAVFRAARKSFGGWEVDGGFFDDQVDRIFYIEAEPPLCAGGCGLPTPNRVGMCYQCQCEVHTEGWYDMDAGYVRV